MLERSIAFGLVVGLLLVFASWANEDEKRPVEPEQVEGLPPEMPEDDDDDDEKEREPERPSDRKRAKGLLGGLLGDD